MGKQLFFNIKKTRAIQYAFIIAIVCCLVFLFSIFFADDVALWDKRINDQFFKLRYTLSGREKIYSNIIHINLRDTDIKNLNLSLWDRTVYGSLVTVLKQAEVKTIGFDLIFQDKSFEENDDALIKAVGKAGIVYNPVVLKPYANPIQYPEHNRTTGENIIYPQIKNEGSPYWAEESVLTFPDLAFASKGLGHITCTPDKDGINRKFPLLFQYEDGYFYSLTLRIICDYLSVDTAAVEIYFEDKIVIKNAFIDNTFKDIKIPIDSKGRILINWTGPWEDSFNHYSFEKVLAGKDNEEIISKLKDIMKGGLVLISDVSTRNKDHGPGIFNSIYPLSGIHLNVLNAILTENFMHEPKIFEKGFICAEVIDFNTLVEAGSFNSAKEKGLVKQEGKEYIINDGDVVLFRFNI